MVDYQSGPDAEAPVEPLGTGPAQQGFLSTTTGKLVVGGVALVLVLAAVGAAVFFFVLNGAIDGAVQMTTTTTTSSPTTSSVEATQAPENPAERSLASTFTFRNVFAPTVKRTYEASAAAAGDPGSTDTTTTTTDALVDVPANTLYLQSIISENGEPKAVFIWNGQTYSVGEGEQVADTPWKVLQINSDSVLMLYGDSQVTLSVGQGVGK